MGGFGGRGDEEGTFPKLPARSAPGELSFSKVFLGMDSFFTASPGSKGFTGEGCPKEKKKKQYKEGLKKKEKIF